MKACVLTFFLVLAIAITILNKLFLAIQTF